MGKRVEKLEYELSSVKSICHLYPVEGKISKNEPEVEEPRSREEKFPNFLMLKFSLDDNDFPVLSINI